MVCNGLRRCLLAAALVAVLAAVPVTGRAQENDESGDGRVILVTATRTQTEAERVASSYTVITREEIERRQAVFVHDLLRDVPGLDIARNGGPGQQTAVFLRGAKSEHTLVLVDGIELNDPISPGRTFDFRSLTTENIERIEIVRGPQSTLYGSDAIGGVINIITRRGTGRPSFFLATEAGSFDTFRQEAGVSGGNQWVNYALSATRTGASGISSASEETGNREDDGFRSTSLSGRVGWTPADTFGLDFFMRYGHSRADIDNAGGAGGDDPNHVFENRWKFFRLQARLELMDERWEQILGVSLTDHDRRDRDDPDPAHPLDSVRASYHSRLVKFDWQHNLYLSDVHTLTLGAETEEERGESVYTSEGAWGPFASVFAERKMRTNGYYVQDQIALGDESGDRFYATVGARLDDHEKFGSETTYRVAPAYLFARSGTKIKGSYGTGFKAPSLFQLYSTYGDPELEPEESKGWDVGLEQDLWDGRATAGVTYFRNDFDDMIDYDYVTSTYGNIGEAETRGVEVFAKVEPMKDVSVRATFTRTYTEDKSTGEDLLRRARNKAGLDVLYNCLGGKADLGVNVTYIGTREDMDFTTWPATRVDLGSYSLVNLTGAYRLTDNCELFARVENLFDKGYEPVSGYGAPGRGVFAGVRVRF